MKQIKIIKCSDSLLWYNTEIDKIYTAYREYEDSYLVRTSDGYSNIIYKTDCEIVKEENNE